MSENDVISQIQNGIFLHEPVLSILFSLQAKYETHPKSLFANRSCASCAVCQTSGHPHQPAWVRWDRQDNTVLQIMVQVRAASRCLANRCLDGKYQRLTVKNMWSTTVIKLLSEQALQGLFLGLAWPGCATELAIAPITRHKAKQLPVSLGADKPRPWVKWHLSQCWKILFDRPLSIHSHLGVLWMIR